MDKLLNHWLTQAGVGAGGTGLSASKTSFNYPIRYDFVFVKLNQEKPKTV
jgi:hypothetical protein